MVGDPKKLAIMILAGKKPSMSSSSEEEGEDMEYEPEDDLEGIAQDIIDAVKNEDAKSLAKALEVFVNNCGE